MRASASIDGGTNISVLVDVNNYTPGSYSYVIGSAASATIAGSSSGSITAAGQFSFTGLAVNSPSLTTDGANLFLNFTVASTVPEPASLLGVAAVALLALRRKW